MDLINTAAMIMLSGSGGGTSGDVFEYLTNLDKINSTALQIGNTDYYADIVLHCVETVCPYVANCNTSSGNYGLKGNITNTKSYYIPVLLVKRGANGEYLWAVHNSYSLSSGSRTYTTNATSEGDLAYSLYSTIDIGDFAVTTTSDTIYTMSSASSTPQLANIVISYSVTTNYYTVENYAWVSTPTRTETRQGSFTNFTPYIISYDGYYPLAVYNSTIGKNECIPYMLELYRQLYIECGYASDYGDEVGTMDAISGSPTWAMP